MSNKIIILFIFLLCIAVMPGISLAVPAAPVTHQLEQADGTTINARQWGDKWSHGWETVDGYSIVFDKSAKKWFYASRDSHGRLKASLKLVGKERPQNIKKHLRPSGEARAQSIDMQAVSSSSAPQSAAPVTGTSNVPVIMINFSNTSTSYTPSDFDNLLFGSGNKSMKDYYEEVSYGVFTVSSGPGGIAGWYTASNTHDYYGQNDGIGYDMWPGTLVREAVEAADPAFDFAPYDQDGDCYVDVIDIVHQGSGEEAGGPATDIWSHRWDLNSANAYGYSSGGEYTTDDICPEGGYIKINDYVMQPEILFGNIQTMGVFAHEYGHALGLPDLYDTNNSSEGIGNWGLMGAGSWNYVTRSGDTPAHMSVWSKLALGWINPTEVAGTLTNEPIEQASSESDVYLLPTGNPAEYFLVENRQQTGFDAGLPGAGLAIWHIDDNKADNTEECDFTADCTSAHYKVALVQADGNWDLENNNNRGNATDMWYLGNAVTFNEMSNPNSNLYNTGPSDISVQSISASTAIMTATLSVTVKSTVFSEDFETGTLGEYWSTSSTNYGRILVTTEYGPYEGSYHITMDDSGNPGEYSLNELVLTIDLSGQIGVMLSFAHKDFLDEDHDMPASFTNSKNSDGVAISADGINWYKVHGLDGTYSNYSTFLVDLDAAVLAAGINYNSTFMIKFQQYDNYPIPSDGFAFDNILITADPQQYLLTTSVSPAGSGSIVPDYSGGQLFDNGTLVILNASETSGYPFISWTGCDSPSNNICTMTMDADKGLTASFDITLTRNMRTLEYYSTLQDAYDAAEDGDTIQARTAVFSDNVFADRNISITFNGGYNSDYSAITGLSTFSATMTVSDGTVIIGDFIFE